MGDAKQDVLKLIRLIASHRGMVKQSIEERALELQAIGEEIDELNPVAAMMGWMSHRVGHEWKTRSYVLHFIENEEVTGEGEAAVVNWWPALARWERQALGSYKDECALQNLARLLFRAGYGPDMARLIGRMETLCKQTSKEFYGHRAIMREIADRMEGRREVRRRRLQDGEV